MPWDTMEPCIPYIDLFYCDINALDEDLHQRGTGVGNRRILQNIQKLAQSTSNLILRTPVIPYFNDNQTEAEGLLRNAV